MRFKGKVVDGAFIPDDLDAIKDFLSRIDGDVILDFKKPCSRALMGYYRGVVVPAIERAGIATGDVHQYLKNEFDVETVSMIAQDEMSLYVCKVVIWAELTHGVRIPGKELK